MPPASAASSGGEPISRPLAYHLAQGDPEAVAEELRVLELALEACERCELCGAAMVVDGTCPECLIAYRGGRGEPLRR